MVTSTIFTNLPHAVIYDFSALASARRPLESFYGVLLSQFGVNALALEPRRADKKILVSLEPVFLADRRSSLDVRVGENKIPFSMSIAPTLSSRLVEFSLKGFWANYRDDASVTVLARDIHATFMRFRIGAVASIRLLLGRTSDGSPSPVGTGEALVQVLLDEGKSTAGLPPRVDIGASKKCILWWQGAPEFCWRCMSAGHKQPGCTAPTCDWPTHSAELAQRFPPLNGEHVVRDAEMAVPPSPTRRPPTPPGGFSTWDPRVHSRATSAPPPHTPPLRSADSMDVVAESPAKGFRPVNSKTTPARVHQARPATPPGLNLSPNRFLANENAVAAHMGMDETPVQPEAVARASPSPRRGRHRSRSPRFLRRRTSASASPASSVSDGVEMRDGSPTLHPASTVAASPADRLEALAFEASSVDAAEEFYSTILASVASLGLDDSFGKESLASDLTGFILEHGSRINQELAHLSSHHPVDRSRFQDMVKHFRVQCADQHQRLVIGLLPPIPDDHVLVPLREALGMARPPPPLLSNPLPPGPLHHPSQAGPTPTN
jgi:hypothetical protein